MTYIRTGLLPVGTVMLKKQILRKIDKRIIIQPFHNRISDQV